MDPIDDLVGGIAALDWVGGFAAAAGAIAVLSVVVTVIERNAHGPGERWSDLAVAALRRWRTARGRTPDPAWRCDRCGSVNPAGGLACYRGCGPRDEVATAIGPSAGDDPGTAPQRGGRSSRRG